MLQPVIRIAFVAVLLAITIAACGKCDCQYVESDVEGNYWCGYTGVRLGYKHLCGPYPGAPPAHCFSAGVISTPSLEEQHYTCCTTEACRVGELPQDD